MVKKRSAGRPRVAGQQIAEMIRLDRQGWSISAIARSVGCHRQTVRVYLKERQADILADEVRKQLLTDELRRHLDELIQFPASLGDYVTAHTSPFDDQDDEAVIDPFWRKGLPKGLESDQRQLRLVRRRNKMLFESLREHIGDKGWWQAFEEWKKAWNTCNVALKEFREEADKEVGRLIKELGFKEEAEKETGEQDTVKKMARPVLWMVWWAGTSDKPVEEAEKVTEYNSRIKEGQLIAEDREGFYPLGLMVSEVALTEDKVVTVCDSAFETLRQSFIDQRIPEALEAEKKKVEEVQDALDPFILRSLLVRSRCALCPA